MSFLVDLGGLSSAIGRVSAEREAIQGGLTDLEAIFEDIREHWQSPAGTSFVVLSTNFSVASGVLLKVLDDGIVRMNTALRNYEQVEERNTANMRVQEDSLRSGGTQSTAGAQSGQNGGAGAKSSAHHATGPTAPPAPPLPTAPPRP